MINVIWKFAGRHWELNDNLIFTNDRLLAERLKEIAETHKDEHIIVNHVELPAAMLNYSAVWDIGTALRFIRHGLILPQGAKAQRALESDQRKP